MVGLVFLVDLLAEVRHPADVVLRPVNLQLGKTVENTGYYELTDVHGSGMMRRLARKTLDKIRGRPPLPFRFYRVLEQRGFARTDFGRETRVDHERHLEIQCRRPKS